MREDGTVNSPGRTTHGTPFHLELRRASVRTLVTGTGPGTLVIIPDPPNVIEHHQEVFERLAGDHRIISFELPGFGRSQLLGGARFGIDAQVDIMTEVLEHLSARQVTLEMSCLGALVGLRLARRRPDLVARLVLAQVSTLAQMQAWARGTDVMNLIHTPGVGQALVSLGKRFIARHWYRSALPEGTDERTYLKYLEPTLASLDAGASFELASAYQEIRRAAEVDYGGIQQPTLLLFGKADRTHAGTEARALQQALPRAELVELEGCGHFPTLEDAGRYVRTLTAFEDSTSPAGRG
jgi:pimeloyl-ACP methyl ester carboxylesterase